MAQPLDSSSKPSSDDSAQSRLMAKTLAEDGAAELQPKLHCGASAPSSANADGELYANFADRNDCAAKLLAHFGGGSIAVGHARPNGRLTVEQCGDVLPV